MSYAEQQERIVSLLTSHQQQLAVYVRSLVPNRTDADEVLQEVNLYLWRHAHELRSEESFTAWVFQTARYQVLTYRKRLSRTRARFSDVMIEQLSEQTTELAKQSDSRQLALEACLKKLPEKDRELILLRYEPEATTQQVAERTGRSLKAIYESFNRIRNRLLECINRTLKAEERAL